MGNMEDDNLYGVFGITISICTYLDKLAIFVFTLKRPIYAKHKIVIRLKTLLEIILSYTETSIF